MATFTSKQFAWADITIALGGRILEGVTEVEYTEKQTKALLFGRGNKPTQVTRSNKEFEGKLKIWQSELEAMTEDAPDRDLLKLNFDVIISYIPQDGGKMVTDILTGVEYTEVKKGMSQGDGFMEIELPIIFLDVKRGV